MNLMLILILMTQCDKQVLKRKQGALFCVEGENISFIGPLLKVHGLTWSPFTPAMIAGFTSVSMSTSPSYLLNNYFLLLCGSIFKIF